MTQATHTPPATPHHPQSTWQQWLQFYERNISVIQWGMIGAALVVAIGIYWYRTTAATEAAAWSTLAQADSPESYAEIASTFPGTQASLWAKLREGNAYLESSLKDAFENREKAVTDLKKAKSLFEELDRSTTPPDVRERAVFGLARVLEMTSDGDLTSALATYQRIAKEFPKSVLVKEATQRVQALEAGGTKSFYAWFSKQNPKPAPPASPHDLPGDKPGTEKNPLDPLTLQIPENSDGPVLKLPTVTDLPRGEKTPSGDQPDKGTQPSDDKASDEKQPEAKAVEEKAAAEDPAADKTAEEKPATEKPAE